MFYLVYSAVCNRHAVLKRWGGFTGIISCMLMCVKAHAPCASEFGTQQIALQFRPSVYTCQRVVVLVLYVYVRAYVHAGCVYVYLCVWYVQCTCMCSP